MNKAILIGNLTKDPELKATPNGISVCTFTVAVSRRYKDESGERQADFIPIVTWRALAENCGKYLEKGKKVAVTGQINTRSYDAQDGTKRYVTEVIAEDVEFLSPQSNNGSQQVPTAGVSDMDSFTEVLESDLPF